MVDIRKDSAATRSPDVARRTALDGRRSLRSPSEALHPESAPPPPPPPQRKRRRPIVATASGLLSFIGIAAIALVVAWSLSLQRINASGPLQSDKVVTIAPGTDVSGIVDQLVDEGVIDSRPLMTAALWIEGNRSNVKAGEYMFKQAASLRDVIDTLVSGKQILHSLTVPEGLTSEQVVDRLREDDALVGDISEVPKEGTLMPDTFKFSRGTTRDQVIRNMTAEQKRVLAEIWARRSPDTPIRSPYDLVTLASIVEKETGRADERPRVAGVFVNRLVHNMPLQSDPTVVYGLAGGKGTLGRGILKSELEQKTPYNTYMMTGLPPGPIANPGKAALEAVANPSRTKDLYFVADGTGGHAFADNLDQHRLNVLRWRQLEKDSKDRASPDVPPSASPAPGVPRGNQRGDLFDPGSIYGAAGGGAVPATTGSSPTTLAHIDAFPFDRFSGGVLQPKTLPGRVPDAAPTPGFNSNFDELDVEVAGVKTKPGPGEEGIDTASPADDTAQQPGSGVTFPVSPQQLADQKSRARAYGLQPASANLQASSAAAFANDPPPVSNHMFGKVSIIDASEGTNLDPLRDKTYDLNSAKVVPTLKPLPTIAPLASSSR